VQVVDQPKKWVWDLDKGKSSGSRSTMESVQVLDKPMKGYRF